MSETPPFDTLYNKALKFLSFRPRSEKEVLDYLTGPRFGKFGKKKPNTDDRTAQKIIKKLKEYKLVDDLEFAKWWIENRRKGKRLLSLELKQKGISKETIEEAESSFDIATKEKELIDKLVEKKWKVASKTPEKAYEKMMRFLMTKGFDYDDVKKAVRSKIKLEDSVDD